MKDFNIVLNELINVELNASELYTIFYKEIEKDSDFWWTLLNEEKNHASLLISSREFLNMLNESFFNDISIEEVKESNKQIKNLIKTFNENPPSRLDALKIAIDLEETAGELHFQKLMTKDPENKIEKILQDLNVADKDHLIRMKKYLKQIS